jgi:soluble lytic murein transglycosylase
MQVTPDAGRYVCKRAGVSFDLNRMKTDSVYNAMLGAAELGGPARGLPRLLHPDLRRLQCRPRQRQEMDRALRRSARSQGRRGRLGRTDPVLRDANYVQRIMENLQVYRARFGGGTRLQIEADLHRGASVQ